MPDLFKVCVLFTAQSAEIGDRRINEDWNLIGGRGRYKRKISSLAEHRTNTAHVFSLSVFVRKHQYPGSSFMNV